MAASSGAAGGEDTLSWVHLSDFHFTPGKDYGRDEVIAALIEDLKIFSGRREVKRGAEKVALDFIFVTGDIAHGGKPAEYERAEAFLRDLRDITGVPRERVFIVPGNHDGDRSEHEPDFFDSLRGRDKFAARWSDPKKRRRIFDRKLAAYRAFAAQVNPTLAIPDDQPGGFFQCVTVKGRTVAIAGLGSSWLGQGGDEDDRWLITGQDQVYDLAGGAGLLGLKDADLKLALMHHPIEWMQEFDRGDLKLVLGKNFDLLLRGHLHETTLEWQAFPGYELRTIAAGASYAGGRYRNAYNVVKLSFGETRRARIWLRAYAAGAKEFVPDVETYPEAEGGSWEWALEGLARRAQTRAAAAAPASPARYLERLKADHLYLDVRGMGAQVAERMELSEVYTRLRVAREMSEGERGEKGKGEAVELREARDLELSEILQENPQLVLVGDPGSGKTTFLRFVALNLARACLGEEPAQAMARLGLAGDPRFPIFVRLGPFGQFLQDHPAADVASDAPEQLYRYLDHTLAGFDLGLPPGFLRDRIHAGGVMLLLDGLDEVPGDATRERVGRIVENVVFEGKRAGNRHIATVRTRAYRGKVQLAQGFARADIVDFGAKEIEDFVARWSRALHRLDPGETASARAEQARAYAQELLDAIRAHPSLGPLTANPLMLTVLAVVHWNKKRIPEQRAELYEAAIEYLVDARKGLSGFKPQERREALRRLALAMFEDPRGVRKTVGRVEAADVIAPLLGVGRERALVFLDDEALHSGLLVTRVDGEFEFWHLTFQEYLAAVELSYLDACFARLEPHLYDPQWREVVLLLGGCLRRLGIAKASGLIAWVLGRDASLTGRAQAVGLLGQVQRDIAPYGGDPAQGTGYAAALEATLAVFAKGAEKVPERTRFEVGEALGQTGDPRLADAKSNQVLIPGGSFLMGAQKKDKTAPGYDAEADDDEAPPHRVTMSSFLIDRYPVTVAEFAKFVGQSGYMDQNLWHPDGWLWREKEKVVSPARWDEQLRHANRPVTGVSWYEADAYARWAGKWLPTEAQWEYAARGSAGRKYPWGNEPPTDQHANFAGKDRLGEPSPVGIYPLGATPDCVQDLAGNVWEWCADGERAYSQAPQTDPAGPATGPARVLRGGAFNGHPWYLRAAYRIHAHPVSRAHFGGFRCVSVAPGGQVN